MVSERSGQREWVQGNVAVAKGAVEGGCRCYFGYPITPQNEIAEYLSTQLPATGGVFLQAESELASINMVLGAASTGARAMTSSSGPGISLMQEGLSYTAGMELPLVVIDVMRCGPGLGGIKPTQGDYFQATRGGGHGDYRTLVLAPGNVQEMFDLTALAFDLADKYRNPTIVLADAILGQMKEPAYLTLREPPKHVDKPWILEGAKGGRARRNICSMYLEGDGQEDHNRALFEKYERMARDEQRFDLRLTEDAECVVVAFGAAARIALSAVRAAREEGLRVGLFRPVTLFPYPVDALRSLSERVKRILVVELNTGQMVEDVRAAVQSDVTVAFHGRPGGGVPTPAEILTKIKEL